MKLRTLIPLAVLIVALSGCSAPPSTGTDSGTDSDTSTDGSTDDGGTAAEPWSECPGIVERLNANENDPTVYEQLGAGEFAVPEVGADVLAGACVVKVTLNDAPVTWAILPGDDALAASITSGLQDAGFVSGGNDLYGDEATGRGVLVKSFASGGGLDAYLIYSTAFAPITEPIVYLGTFALG